jgi:hypothetical protein
MSADRDEMVLQVMNIAQVEYDDARRALEVEHVRAALKCGRDR